MYVYSWPIPTNVCTTASMASSTVQLRLNLPHPLHSRVYTVFAPLPANRGCNGAARGNRTTQPWFSILHILSFYCNASSSASVATYRIATAGGWCDHHTVMRCSGHASTPARRNRRTAEHQQLQQLLKVLLRQHAATRLPQLLGWLQYHNGGRSVCTRCGDARTLHCTAMAYTTEAKSRRHKEGQHTSPDPTCSAHHLERLDF